MNTSNVLSTERSHAILQQWQALRRTETKVDLSFGLVILAVGLLLPALDPGRYALSQITLFFIWAGIVTQWNLIFGVAGVFSMAQMAVFVVGGYAAAMLGFYFAVPLWIGLPLGGLAGALFSLVLGLATLRLRGPYVMLLTLAVAVAVQALLNGDVGCFVKESTTCYPLTGGPRGLIKFGDFGFVQWLGYKHAPLGNYYLCLAILAIGTICSIVIIRSPLGSAFRALRDNQALAASRGVAKIKYQVLVFMLSGFFTGLAGVLYAGQFKTIGPNMLDVSTLLFLLSMLVIGGIGTRWGPFIGCAVIMLSQELLGDLAEWRMIAFGIITVIFVVVLKDGIVGVVEKLWASGARLGPTPMEKDTSSAGEVIRAM